MSDDDDDFDGKPTPSRQGTPKPYRMTDSQRDTRRGLVRGVPAFDSETTDRLEMLLTGQPDVHGHLAELRRRDVHELIWNLADSLAGYRAAVRKEQSSSEQVRGQVIAAIDENQRQVSEMANRISNLETDGRETKRKLGFAQKVAATAITIALAAGGGLISKIWDRAGDEREARVRAAYMQQDIDRLTKQMERASRKDTP